jgi:hypothetical protein
MSKIKEAQEKSKSQIELILLVKTLMEKVEFLEAQVKYLNAQTKENENSIYQIVRSL